MDFSRQIQEILTRIDGHVRNLQDCIRKKNFLHSRLVQMHQEPLPYQISSAIFSSYISQMCYSMYLEEICRENEIRLCIWEEKDKLNKFYETLSNVLVQNLISQANEQVKLIEIIENIMSNQDHLIKMYENLSK